MKIPSLILSLLAGSAMLSSLQAQAPHAYYLGRLGLFSDPAYTHPGYSGFGSDAFQISYYLSLTNTGFASGYSQRFAFDSNAGFDVWTANMYSGVTTQVGLFTGTEFNSSFGIRSSTLQQLTESGLAIGKSDRYNNGGSFAPVLGEATWVADAISGVTLRTGIYSGAEYTTTSGIQQSNTLGITESGLVYGTSQRYNGNAAFGQATWMTNTDNGVTSRIGYFGAGYSGTGNLQQSSIVGVSDLEYVAGNSVRYSGAAVHGNSAWVGARVNGATYPVGLYLPPTYLRADGFGNTVAVGITKSGYVFGQSARFSGTTDIGRAAWAHNLSNNTVKRLGLTAAGYSLGATGYQVSDSTVASESGFIGGISQRFAGAVPIGQAAWVAAFTDGISVRAGLTAAEFTKSTGFQSSSIVGLTQQGNGYGVSERYVSDALKGNGTWVFTKTTGVTTRVGLTDVTHTQSGNVQAGAFLPFPASTAGWVAGISYNIYTPPSNTETPWVASTNTGVTIPVGLTGADYTAADGSKGTTISGFTASSHAYGISKRYIAGVAKGQAAWVANFNSTGASVRIGFFGTPEFVRADGSENTVIEGFNKAGYIWGYSSRAESSGGGAVAWVYNLNTGTQQTFKVQVSIDGKTSTGVNGVTDNGLVHGAFTAYDPTTGVLIGNKHFVWSLAKGYIVLEDQIGAALTTNNWSKINYFLLNNSGLILSGGNRVNNGPTNPGGYGVFRAYVIP